MRRMPFEERERAQKVSGVAAPAAADLQMLAVDLPVRVDGARPDVGVVAGDDVAAAVAHEIQSFFDGARRAGCLDGDVYAFSMRSREHCFESRIRRRRVEIEDLVRSHLAREREAARWRANHEDG